MASYGYVQLFLFGLLCIGAASVGISACPTIRALSDLDINKLYGDWFVGKIVGLGNYEEDKSRCFGSSITKINETTLQFGVDDSGPETYTIESSENAGTWRDVDIKSLVPVMDVIYLSADRSTMELAFCIKNQTAPGLLLLSKQLPLSSEKKAELLHAEEIAGVQESIYSFKWESEATCPSA
ncbi:uncharacterized protein [Anabrus simplex]|uniref:uncharacterized protein n=1 Tax=Anabrus simplex TaxID=316456 RepID=UPI0035A37EF9